MGAGLIPVAQSPSPLTLWPVFLVRPAPSCITSVTQTIFGPRGINSWGEAQTRSTAPHE